MESSELQEPDPSPGISESDRPVVSPSNDQTGFEDDPQAEQKEPFVLQNTSYTPDSADENARKTGLAWSAGIVFFSSIVFTLFLGWIADLLLGSSPWGLVGGIVLGSVIGFIQFFRISSQIFGNAAPKSGPHSLFDDQDDNK